jgi:DNA-binding CsgD family transcriptional regulator
MRVFIGWSGERSKAVAVALKALLEDIFDSVEPFLSAHMDAGVRWEQQVLGELKTTRVGILCLTPESLDSQWIMFEAGALANAVEGALVIPYLFDLDPTSVELPLSQFQWAEADEEGTRDLVRQVNEALGDARRPDAKWERRFRICYPLFQEQLAKIPSPEGKGREPRRPAELLKEILKVVRLLGQELLATENRPTGGLGASASTTGPALPRSITKQELLERRIVDRLFKAMPIEAIAESLETTRAHVRGVYYKYRDLFENKRWDLAGLEKSDRSIIRMLAAGLTSLERAKALDISQEALQARENKLALRLGLSGRTELMEKARELAESEDSQ